MCQSELSIASQTETVQGAGYGNRLYRFLNIAFVSAFPEIVPISVTNGVRWCNYSSSNCFSMYIHSRDLSHALSSDVGVQKK